MIDCRAWNVAQLLSSRMTDRYPGGWNTAGLNFLMPKSPFILYLHFLSPLKKYTPAMWSRKPTPFCHEHSSHPLLRQLHCRGLWCLRHFVSSLAALSSMLILGDWLYQSVGLWADRRICPRNRRWSGSQSSAWSRPIGDCRKAGYRGSAREDIIHRKRDSNVERNASDMRKRTRRLIHRSRTVLELKTGPLPRNPTAGVVPASPYKWVDIPSFPTATLKAENVTTKWSIVNPTVVSTLETLLFTTMTAFSKTGVGGYREFHANETIRRMLCWFSSRSWNEENGCKVSCQNARLGWFFLFLIPWTILNLESITHPTVWFVRWRSNSHVNFLHSYVGSDSKWFPFIFIGSWWQDGDDHEH
jgi:hypothetical protein